MKKALVAMLMLATAIPAIAETITFNINDDKKRDIVTFTSKAPLETIVGRTAEIKGFVTLDPDDIAGTAQAAFEVNLASLKTGINLRDKHMKEQYLETDKYPTAVFKMTGVSNASENVLKDNTVIEFTAQGDFTMHGVTKEMSIPIAVKYMKKSEQTQARLPGDLLQITAEFYLLLSDFHIKRPQFIILKLDDRQKIYIDLFASTELPEVAVSR